MVIDNAPAHVVLENLSAVKLVFLVANTTALSQPLDQGSIWSVKHLYRQNMLRRMLLTIESDKTYNIDMLGAIHLLAHTWQQVKAATVKNCFARGQFVMPAQEINSSKVDADEEVADDSDCEALLAEVLERQGGGDTVPFLAFCDVDNDTETYEDLSDSDIVNSLSTKLCSASDGEDDDNAELEDVPCPSFGEAV
ncbi:hypothetical protein HPB49_003111 [Dermacentor silvarum]|uniref:Uncharacterized protein n=1 Tax=Dermacentor silvarum TaxID=543639 RepID=A0ACB8DTN9_DERSI|nr:tigger transposable element-derived protein 6 [Dermacentor silvarum]KAH7977638.1 hypothetical protein HPB49_003111 [Dermacentor silvarum]